MGNIQGQEFHSILLNIFQDVKGLNVSSQLTTCCPKCQEEGGLSYPDGKFNLEISTAFGKRFFKCWKCEPRFSGSLGKLIRLYGTKADYELYKSYADIYGDDTYYSDEEKEYAPVILPREMILFSEMEITNSEHFEAYNYLLNERQISREMMLKYRLGFCVEGRYSRRIIIPSYDSSGEINYFVSRTYDPTVKKMKYDNPKSDKDRIIFNEGLVNWDSTVILVEGVFDMFSVPNAIPLLGKTLSTTLFMKLKEMKPNVVVLLDPDAYKDCIELYYQLHTIYVDCEERVKLVKLPTNDDVDELRRNHGQDAVIKALRTARDLTVDDYFIKKLQKPYDYSRTGRYDSNSKYFGWKSGSTRNGI